MTILSLCRGRQRNHCGGIDVSHGTATFAIAVSCELTIPAREAWEEWNRSLLWPVVTGERDDDVENISARRRCQNEISRRTS